MRNLVLLLLVAAFAYFIWPTLWQVQSHLPGVVTRINRLTGEQELRTDTGWVAVPPSAGPSSMISNVRKAVFTSQQKTAEIQMRHFGTAIDSYFMANHKLPESLETLTQTSDKNPRPYLDEIRPDPWDNPYEYRIEGKKFALRSLGEDGQPDTADDIVWPARKD